MGMNVLWRDMCVTTMIIKLCENEKKKKNKQTNLI